MLNVGGPELLIILLVALIVLGPERLPGAARQVGRTVNQLRSMAQGFQQELEAAAKPDLSGGQTSTNPEHIRTAAKATGAQVFGGTGVDHEVSADETTGGTNGDIAAEIKPKSPGGPEIAATDEQTSNAQSDIAPAGSEPQDDE